MAIVLVRHGETEGNARRFLQHPDTPLSARGEAQALRVAARLAEHRLGEIVASDYARARGTAERIQQASRAPLDFDPGLRERNFGDLRGRPYADLAFDPFAPDYVPPAGESWEDLHVRVDAMWGRACARAAALEGDLVLVTHGLVCHSLVSRRLELSGRPAPDGFGNTAVTIIDSREPFAVTLLACTAHLDEETSHDSRTVSGL